MRLFLFHTPELVPSDCQPDCAVVIDVLRATTTIATALAAGAEAVQVFADLESLRQTSAAWPESARLLAGERGGQAVDGFDLGNSPLSYTPERVQGKRIFMSTTNGTRALQQVQSAPVVVTAALINLAAVVKFLQQGGFETLWLVGSGWQGSYSLEDTVCGGAIAAQLGVASHPQWIGNDEVVAAVALYHQWQANLLGLLKQASHGQRLLNLGQQYEADLEHCSALSTLHILPWQKEMGVLLTHPIAV